MSDTYDQWRRNYENAFRRETKFARAVAVIRSEFHSDSALLEVLNAAHQNMKADVERLQARPEFEWYRSEDDD